MSYWLYSIVGDRVLVEEDSVPTFTTDTARTVASTVLWKRGEGETAEEEIMTEFYTLRRRRESRYLAEGGAFTSRPEDAARMTYLEALERFYKYVKNPVYPNPVGGLANRDYQASDISSEPGLEIVLVRACVADVTPVSILE